MDGVVDVADAQATLFAAPQAFAQRFQTFGMLEQATGFTQEGAPVSRQEQALITPLEQCQFRTAPFFRVMLATCCVLPAKKSAGILQRNHFVLANLHSVLIMAVIFVEKSHLDSSSYA